MENTLKDIQDSLEWILGVATSYKAEMASGKQLTAYRVETMIMHLHDQLGELLDANKEFFKENSDESEDD